MGSILLLLLLCLETLRKPITITITITFPSLLHLLLLLNQRNTAQADYKVISKDLYYFHGITHYHRHIITNNIIITLSWEFCGVIVYYWQMQPPITITITGSIWPDYYYYYYYYSGILRSPLLLLLLSRHKGFITITITISNSLTTLFIFTMKMHIFKDDNYNQRPVLENHLQLFQCTETISLFQSNRKCCMNLCKQYNLHSSLLVPVIQIIFGWTAAAQNLYNKYGYWTPIKDF